MNRYSLRGDDPAMPLLMLEGDTWDPNRKETMKLILPNNNLPKDLKSRESLTLDELDKRDVRVEVDLKKSHRIPRVRITNKTITLLANLALPLPIAKDVIAMAAEARQRLRHPNNQAHADPLPGVAYGKFENYGGKILGLLTVTIGGKEVATVKAEDLKKEKPENGETRIAKHIS